MKKWIVVDVRETIIAETDNWEIVCDLIRQHPEYTWREATIPGHEVRGEEA